MMRFEPAGWHLAWGNLAVFAIVCGIAFGLGAIDPWAGVIS